MIRTPMSFLLSILNKSSFFKLSLYVKYSSVALLGTVNFFQCRSWTREKKSGHKYSRGTNMGIVFKVWHNKHQAEWNTHMTWNADAAQGMSCCTAIIFNVATPNQVYLSMYCCWGLVCPQCRTLHFLLLNLMEVLLAQSSIFFPSTLSTSSLRLLLLANERTVHSVLSGRSRIKILNNTEPSISSGGTPLLITAITILWTCLFNQFSKQIMVLLSNPSYNQDVGRPCQKLLILPFICLASCFIIQSNQVGQAQFPPGKFLLPFPRLLHVPGNSFCEDLFQPLKWDWLFSIFLYFPFWVFCTCAQYLSRGSSCLISSGGKTCKGW